MSEGKDTRDPARAVEALVTDPPAWLSDDARGYWADLMRHLPEEAIKAADAHTFAMLCNELATHAEADQLVQAAGLLVTGGMGTLMPNPALAIRDKTSAAVARWYAFLGIAPGERAANARERAAAEAARRQPGGLRHRSE